MVAQPPGSPAFKALHHSLAVEHRELTATELPVSFDFNEPHRHTGHEALIQSHLQ